MVDFSDSSQKICQKIRQRNCKHFVKKIVKNSQNLKEPTPSNTKVTNSLDAQDKNDQKQRVILVLRSSARPLANGEKGNNKKLLTR